MSVVKIQSGDTLDLIYTIVDQDGTVIDLTGGSISWVAYINGTSTEVINKTGVLTTPVSGITTVFLAPSDTVSLDGVYNIEGKHTTSEDDVYTFEEGELVVS
jgi:hypothetical protein